MVLMAENAKCARALARCARDCQGEGGLRITPSKSQHMVVGNCADVISDIPRVDNFKYLGVHFGPVGVDAAVDQQKKKVK